MSGELGTSKIWEFAKPVGGTAGLASQRFLLLQNSGGEYAAANAAIAAVVCNRYAAIWSYCRAAVDAS